VHTLRHTAVSRMTASGVDDFTVMAISDHRSVRMLERYAHPSSAQKLEALDVDLDGPKLGSTAAARVEKLVDGARLELATSALRTRRSPN